MCINFDVLSPNIYLLIARLFISWRIIIFTRDSWLLTSLPFLNSLQPHLLRNIHKIKCKVFIVAICSLLRFLRNCWCQKHLTTAFHYTGQLLSSHYTLQIVFTRAQSTIHITPLLSVFSRTIMYSFMALNRWHFTRCKVFQNSYLF